MKNYQNCIELCDAIRSATKRKKSWSYLLVLASYTGCFKTLLEKLKGSQKIIAEEVLNCALRSNITKGWHLFPVHSIQSERCSCNNSNCQSPGKHPRIKEWHKNASVDENQIREWWTKWPDANIGIATGKKSGFFVIDIDPRNNGDGSFAELIKKNGAIPRTVEALSGGGGKHLYFKTPTDGSAIPKITGLVRGIDIQGERAFIVAPPSKHISGNTYEWERSSHPDHIEIAEAPKWLLELIYTYNGKMKSESTNSHFTGQSIIKEGGRNKLLTSLAGAMRRKGLQPQEIIPSLSKVNELRCIPPLNCKEVEKIAYSINKYNPSDSLFISIPSTPVSLIDLILRHQGLREPVIDGLLRKGETMNIISPPKIGKSWLVIYLAIAVATGNSWLGFKCTQGKVLIIDNELHPETITNRVTVVADALNVDISDIGDQIQIINLRGSLQDLIKIENTLMQLGPDRFQLVILDAFYRFLPMNTDENDNGSMANLYNHIDRYAEYLKCSFVLIHHATKGSQSGKSITDVGAGAGAQSRATDTHLILRPHDEDNAFVLDAAVRSWPPIEAKCLRWNYPIWTLAGDLDPADLKSDRRRKSRKDKDKEDSKPSYTSETFTQKFISEEPQIKDCITAAAEEDGLSARKAERLLKVAVAKNLVYRWRLEDRQIGYATIQQPEEAVECENTKQSKREAIEQLIETNPELTAKEIAEQCNASEDYVRKRRRKMKKG